MCLKWIRLAILKAAAGGIADADTTEVRFHKGCKERYEARMQIRKKPTALAVVTCYLGWELILQPLWNLNLERLAEKQQIDDALVKGSGMMAWVWSFASYVPSSFGLGFVIGGLIFAYWDVILRAVNAWVLRKDSPLDLRSWVGKMEPYIDLEKGEIVLVLSVIGVGSTAFRVERVGGGIVFNYNWRGTRYRHVMPTPEIIHNPTQDRVISQGEYCVLHLHQPIPSPLQEFMPGIFWEKPFPSLDFEDLKIFIASEDGRLEKTLNLWASVRLSAGQTQIRAVETIKLFKSEEEARKLGEGLIAVAKLLNRN